eukprot:g77980.t1
MPALKPHQMQRRCLFCHDLSLGAGDVMSDTKWDRYARLPHFSIFHDNTHNRCKIFVFNFLQGRGPEIKNEKKKNRTLLLCLKYFSAPDRIAL